jgi:hypothetical protein
MKKRIYVSGLPPEDLLDASLYRRLKISVREYDHIWIKNDIL